MNKPSIFKNTAMITTLSCLERALGFLYRIVLARLLGAEGVGVYQIALSHFFLFQTAAGGGIPVTLSRTVAKLRADKKESLSCGALIAALLLGLCVSLPITLILFPLADKIPLFSSDASALKILLLCLSATSAYVAVKGFFWGNKQFLAPSMFEMVEEILTVLLGVTLLSGATNLTPLQGAERAAWAHSIACIAVFVIALLTLLAQKPKWSSPTPFLRPILSSAVPITAVRSGATLVNAAIAVLLPAMLVRAGLTESEAVQAFGVVTGMVFPLLAIPLTVIGSLAIVLVPELSEDFAKRNFKRLSNNIERGIFFSVLIACLLVPFFSALGNHLGALTYQNILAGEMLSKCAFLLIPMSVNAILMSILNSLGFEKQTFVFCLVGSALLLLCILFLPFVVGIYAFPIGMFLQFALEAVCSMILLTKHCPLSKVFFKRCSLCILLTLPLGYLGKLSLVGFSRFLGKWLAPSCSAIFLAILVFCVYFGCKLIKFPKKNSSLP